MGNCLKLKTIDNTPERFKKRREEIMDDAERSRCKICKNWIGTGIPPVPYPFSKKTYGSAKVYEKCLKYHLNSRRVYKNLVLDHYKSLHPDVDNIERIVESHRII